MENASKALIIAGEILIGVLILSLASYMLIQFGNFSKNMNEQMSLTEIRAFNVKFTNFSERANISMQEIVSIVNFANKSNSNYGVSSENPGAYFVDVKINGVSILDKPINNLLEDNKNTIYYSCNIELSKIEIENSESGKIIIKAKRNYKNSDITYNEGTGLVNMINFNKIDDTDYANAILQGATITWKN